MQLNKSKGIVKESKEISECTMLLRDVATGFNNKKDVTVCIIVLLSNEQIRGMNGFIGISFLS